MDTFMSSNLEELVKITEVAEFFLVILFNRQIITDGEKSEILTKHDNYVRASLLYQKLSQKALEDDYALFLEALKESRNKKAYKYFVDNYKPLDGFEGASFSSTRSASSVAIRSVPSRVSTTATVSNNGNEGSHYQINTGMKALIINVLKNRPGADKDTRPLRKTLAGCGFQVNICPNLSKQGILSSVSEFKKSLSSVDCILIAIMSHGENSTFFLTDDGQLIDSYQITQQFNSRNCSALKGKPKIFLFNFCRGERLLHEDLANLQLDSGGLYSDIIKCYSTYDRHVSMRNYGTWFIQSFCEVMQANCDGTTSFTEIMNKVHDDVTEKGYGDSRQCPTYENTGFKGLYLESLPPIPCHYFLCQDSVKVENYDGHLKEMHNVDTLKLDKAVLTQCWSYLLEWATAIPPTPLEAFGETFVLNLTGLHYTWEPSMCLWLMLLGNRATAENFKYIFKLLPQTDTKAKVEASFGPLSVVAFQDGALAGVGEKEGVEKIAKDSVFNYCRPSTKLFKATIEILKVA